MIKTVTLQFQIIEGGLNKKGGGGGGPTDNLNINKLGGGQIKGGEGVVLKIVLYQKWQPVTTNYGYCFG